jgi:hypothetical protein
MDDLHRMQLLDTYRADLAREAEKAPFGAALPSRPATRHTLLIMAVLLIGMLTWWIH